MFLIKNIWIYHKYNKLQVIFKMKPSICITYIKRYISKENSSASKYPAEKLLVIAHTIALLYRALHYKKTETALRLTEKRTFVREEKGLPGTIGRRQHCVLGNFLWGIGHATTVNKCISSARQEFVSLLNQSRYTCLVSYNSKFVGNKILL